MRAQNMGCMEFACVSNGRYMICNEMFAAATVPMRAHWRKDSSEVFFFCHLKGKKVYNSIRRIPTIPHGMFTLRSIAGFIMHRPLFSTMRRTPLLPIRRPFFGIAPKFITSAIQTSDGDIFLHALFAASGQDVVRDELTGHEDGFSGGVGREERGRQRMTFSKSCVFVLRLFACCVWEAVDGEFGKF